jgi:site-specific DNA-methyltransferase (adenine-specific)
VGVRQSAYGSQKLTDGLSQGTPVRGFSTKAVFCTSFGSWYQADCCELLRSLDDGSVHTIFADPPFNLGKKYGRKGSDERADSEYRAWCETWLMDAVRVLAPGGSLFLYHLPRWLLPLGAFLCGRPEMTFRHWIAIYRPQSLPIPGKLSPSHYGMLYFTKGKRPRVFNRDAVRIPVAKCRHCGREIKDYGGHKKYLNPRGLNLTDVWTDVPPVRHKKFKHRATNELPAKVSERIIRLSTNRGDLVLDPFGGAGSTAVAAEQLKRRWIVGDINSYSGPRRRLGLLASVTSNGGVH